MMKTLIQVQLDVDLKKFVKIQYTLIGDKYVKDL